MSPIRIAVKADDSLTSFLVISEKKRWIGLALSRLHVDSFFHATKLENIWHETFLYSLLEHIPPN